MSSQPPASLGTKVSSVLLALVLVVITILVDIVLYISSSTYLSANDHFMGLIWIGVLGLIFSLLAYLLQAATTDPTIAHALSLGYLGFGLAVLFGAVLIAPDSAYGGSPSTWTFSADRIIGLIVVLAVLVLVLVIMRWNFMADTRADAREDKRQQWRNEMAAKNAAAARDSNSKASGGSGGN